MLGALGPPTLPQPCSPKEVTSPKSSLWLLAGQVPEKVSPQMSLKLNFILTATLRHPHSNPSSSSQHPSARGTQQLHPTQRGIGGAAHRGADSAQRDGSSQSHPEYPVLMLSVPFSPHYLQNLRSSLRKILFFFPALGTEAQIFCSPCSTSSVPPIFTLKFQPSRGKIR